MSFKLSIYVCGLLAVSIHADGTPASEILEQALQAAYPDLPLALKASGVVYKAMARDASEGKEKNAIAPIWNSMIETLTSREGAETFKMVMAKVKDIFGDENAQKTLITILTTLYSCLTFEVTENNVNFPWKELKRLMSTSNTRVFPMVDERLRKIALDPRTKENFSLLVNTTEETIDEVEEEVISNDGSRFGNRYASRDVNFVEGDLLSSLEARDIQEGEQLKNGFLFKDSKEAIKENSNPAKKQIPGVDT